MPLQIETSKIAPDIALVVIAGKLAVERETQRIEALIQELAGKSERKLIFDMTGVTAIDSSGIGVLAYCAGKMKEAGGQLRIVGANGRVLRLLQMTQLDAVVPLHPDLASATRDL